MSNTQQKLLLALPLSFSLLANAQEPTDSGNQEPAQENKRAMEEVYVTATKRSKSVRDIPVSIDAFNGDSLVEQGATSLEDILKFSPGVVATPGSDPDNAKIVIRGVNSSGSNGVYGRTAGLFFEDVPLVNPSIRGPQMNIDPYDMATVEILKGPQGTLFGGSALAGAVRYVPAKPDFEESYARISFGYGAVEHSNDNSSEVSAMGNLRLGERIALRVAGTKRETAGFVDDTKYNSDDINSSDTTQKRAILAVDVLENLALKAIWLDRERDSGGGPRVTNFENYAVSNREFREEFGRSEGEIKSLTLNWGLPWFSVVASGARLEKSQIQSSDLSATLGTEPLNQSLFQFVTSDDEIETLEFRLVSNGRTEGGWLLGNWEYVLGYFEMEADQNLGSPICTDVSEPINEALPVGLVPVVTLLDPFAPGESFDGNRTCRSTGRQNAVAAVDTFLSALAEEEAIFFDLTKYLFDERLEINIGGRLFDTINDLRTIDRRVEGFGLSDAAADSGAVGGMTVQEEDGYNPKYAISWHFREHITFIASAAKGFRFGGVNSPVNRQEQPLFYRSDSLWNYEIGVRTDWLDGALRVDATAFQIDWEDLQVDQLYLGAFAHVDNVGAAEIEGAEMAVTALLPWDLRLSANVGYTNTRITEPFDSATGFADEGTPLPNTPLWGGSAILSHSATWRNAVVSSSVSFTYQGDAPNALPQSGPDRIDQFRTVGANLIVSLPAWRFSPSIRLTATNLLAEKAQTFVLPVGVSPEPFQIALPPRTITAVVELSL